MMEINESVPIKTYYIIRLLCIIGIVILIAISFLEIYSTKNYVCTTATISNIYKTVQLGIEDNSKTTVIKFVEYRYDIDGVEYFTKQRTFFAFRKKVGDTAKIYCSASNPTAVRNVFKLEVCGLGLLFFSVFLIAICKMIGVIKK